MGNNQAQSAAAPGAWQKWCYFTYTAARRKLGSRTRCLGQVTIYIYVYIYERKYHHEQKRPYLNQKVDRGDGDTRGKPILQQLVFKGIQSFACAHTLQAKKYSRVPKVSNDGFDHASHKGKPKTTTKMCYLVIKGICPCLVLFWGQPFKVQPASWALGCT